VVVTTMTLAILVLMVWKPEALELA